MVLKRLATWPAIWRVPPARHPLLEKFIQLLKLVCTFPHLLRARALSISNDCATLSRGVNFARPKVGILNCLF